MTELVLYYILPNVVMFGGLYVIAKALECVSWKFIVWYADDA